MFNSKVLVITAKGIQMDSRHELQMTRVQDIDPAVEASSKCSWDGHALGLEAELEGVQHLERS